MRTYLVFHHQVLASIILAVLFASSPLARGEEESSPPPTGIEGALQRLKDAGITPLFNYQGEEFANFSGGVGQGGNYEGLLKFGLTLDMDKLVKWNGATIYASVLYPHGLGITNRYVHDYNVLSNIDAYDSWRLFEGWLQQDLWDHRFFIRIGQLTTDNNFMVSDNSNLYINSVFGPIGTSLHNIFDPIYPSGSPGVHLKFSPTPAWYLQAMMVSDDPGAQDSVNKHGIRYKLDGHTRPLTFVEAAYQRLGTDTKAILEGKYKIGGYYDAGTFPEYQRPISHEGTYAVYAVVDQQLYRTSWNPKDPYRGLGMFARWSVAPEDYNPVSRYFDVGFNYTGLFNGHEKDVLGVAFSYERLSSELTQPNGDPVPSHHEHVIEATYLYNFNDHFSVQPDLQYIFNPGGTGTTPNALVGGIRFNVIF